MIKMPRSVQLKMYRQELYDAENNLEDTELFHSLLHKGKQLLSFSNYQFHYWEKGCSHTGLARIMVLHLLEQEANAAITRVEKREKTLAAGKRALSLLMKGIIGVVFFFVSLQYARWAMVSDHPFVVLLPVFFFYAMVIWYRHPDAKN
jgi:hypothetical protein